MPWTIEPYVGADDLRFGMSPAQVAALIGKPDRSRDRAPGRISEFRALHEPIVEYRGGKVSELIFGRQATQVMLRGVDLLAPDKTDVLRRLLTISSDLVELDGCDIASLQLGLTMSGFQDPDDSNKSVNAFERGLFDGDVRDARPLRL